MRTKLYVGCKAGARKIFRSAHTPTEETHGTQFDAVVGPFRTKAGAALCAGPHGNQQTVAEFERSARVLLGQHELCVAYAQHLKRQQSKA